MTQAPRGSLLRRLGCGALLAVASAALALGAAEVALRLFAPQALLHDPDAFVADPVLGARLKPGFTDRVVTTEFSSVWRINAEGYRGPVAGASGSPALRIAALGDSFTFGYGVEEGQAWPAVLEKILDTGGEPGRRVEVVNLGVGGYGTCQEVAWLREKQEALEPGIALLAFYVGNDPPDNERVLDEVWHLGESDRESAATQSHGPSDSERLKRWLGSRLHVYSFVSTRADELLVRLGLRRLVYPFEMEVLIEPEPPHVARTWEASRFCLQGLAELSRAGGARPLVVAVPMKHQVSDEVWSRLTRYYAGGSQGGFDRDRPQRMLVDLCRDLEIETLDLLPGLREAATAAGEDGRDYYWPRDQHWNARGHAEAARLIAAWLREKDRLLPMSGAARRIVGSTGGTVAQPP